MNKKLSLFAVVITASAIGYVLSRPPELSRRGNRKLPATPRFAIAQPLAVPQESTRHRSGLAIAVEADAPMDDELRIEIATSQSSVETGRVRVGGPDYRPTALPRGRLFVAVVCSGLAEDRQRALRDQFAWPAVQMVAANEVALGARVVFRFRSDATKNAIEVRGRTRADEPVPGARVRLMRRASGTRVLFPFADATLDRAGAAEIRGMPQGMFEPTVVAAPRPYKAKTPYPLMLGESRSRVSLVFYKTGTVVGTLPPAIGQEQREDVSFYRVTESGYVPVGAVHADDQGRFEKDGLALGAYVAVIWTYGRQPGYAHFVVRAGATTHVAVDANVGGRTVRGTLAAADGTPVIRRLVNLNTPQTVTAPPLGRSLQTSATGTFEWTNAAFGPQRLIIWDAGLFHDVATMDSNVDLALKLPATRGACTLRGTVRRSDKSAVIGAWVCIAQERGPWTRFCITGGGGDYAFTGLQPGSYKVWIEPSPAVNGFAPSPIRNVEVGAAGSDLDLILPQG